MSDVLKVARERQSDLRREISELDEFIRMAEELLQGAKAAPESRPERQHPLERQERTEAAEVVEATATAPAAQPEMEPESKPESVARRFPWSNMQPPVRKPGDEQVGPTRHNLMRREAS